MPELFDSENAAGMLRRQQSLWAVIESISSELELRPLLTLIVRHACDLLDADHGTIGLVDAERSVIRTEAAYRMPPDELGAEMAPGVGLAGSVFESGRPLVLDRYGEVERPVQPNLLRNAVIGVPIFWHEQMIGFFGLGSPPPRRFTERDVETLSMFAKHAAIAIENARLFDGMQNALAEMQMLYETSGRIAEATTIDEVVVAYLEQVAARGRCACTVVLYEQNAAGQKTAVVARGRWACDEGVTLCEARLPYTHDSLDPPLDRGETVTIADVHSDPRVSSSLRALQQEAGRPALAFIPLMTRGNRIGLVVLSDPHVHDWQHAALHPYQVTAVQLATALDSKIQQLHLADRDQQVAVLEERQRIARDLHDSVTQLLFSMTLIAQTIGPVWRRDPNEGERRVQRLLDLSQSALAEMRAMLAKLHPPEAAAALPPVPTESERIRRDGLGGALRMRCEALKHEGLRVSLDISEYAPQPAHIEEALYRIAIEALHNVIKHARTDSAVLCLRVDGPAACLIVKDGGAGMRVDSAEGVTLGGLGLITMQERARTLGGVLHISSEPGSGTTVEAVLPIENRGDP